LRAHLSLAASFHPDEKKTTSRNLALQKYAKMPLIGHRPRNEVARTVDLGQQTGGYPWKIPLLMDSSSGFRNLTGFSMSENGLTSNQYNGMA
jgi:hypothetical protein